jgi:hypothetical protein
MATATYDMHYGLPLAILLGLQNKMLYMGTVPEAEVARRRSKNKVARRQRRVNRLRSA